MKINESLKASIYYIFGNVLGQGIVLIGIVLFSRILSKQDYGMVSTYNACVQIASSFIGLNLFFSLRNAYMEYRNNYLKVRSSVMTLSLLLFLIFSILTVIGSYVFGYGGQMFYIVCILLQSYAMSAIIYFDNSLSMMGKYKSRTLLLIIPNAGHTLLSLVLIFFMEKDLVLGKVLGNVIFLSIVAVVLIVVIYVNGKEFINREYWKYSLKISVPSVFQSMSNIIIMQCDQIMITYFISPEETAVYSLVYYVGYILYAILMATSAAWIPWFYLKMDIGDTKSICKVQKWYVYAFAVMATGLYMIGPEIVKIIAPKSYWLGAIYAGPFILSSFIMLLNSFYAYLFLFYKKAYIISAATVITATINIILNFIFIPLYGGIAAMYSTVISYLILFLIYMVWTEKTGDSTFSNRNFIRSLAVVSAGCLIYLGVYRTIVLRYAVYLCILAVSIRLCWKHKQEILMISCEGD